MRRFLGLMAVCLLVLLIAAPAALADSSPSHTGRVLMAFDGGVDVAAGEQADAVIVFSGDTTIAGQVTSVVVFDGNVSVQGGTVDTIVVVRGSVTLGENSHVTGNVWTLDAPVSQAPTAVLDGEVKGVESSLAAIGVLLVPALLLFIIGLGLVTVVAAVVVALIAARQVRTAEALITREPLLTVIIGFVGAFVLPLAAVAAMFTVVGAPLGLAVLLMVLPALAYAGWIVAAIWVGDWILSRGRGSVEPDRPVLAAVVGVIVLAVAGLFPFISAFASAFGVGALLLYAWRLILRHPVVPAVAPVGPAAA